MHIMIFVHIMTQTVHIPKNTDIIASFCKGLKVLESFDTNRPRQSITEVSINTGLDRATSRRCLLTLHKLGYADHDGKYFKLTPLVLRLGISAVAALPLSRIVQPWLDQLSEQIGQTCSVSILDDTEIVYIARATQHRVMSIGLLPGSRLPAYCTSMGRVLLASLPIETVKARIEKSDLTPRTSLSLADSNEILNEIVKVGEQGYAVVDQEIELGLRSLAVPVINMQGTIVAALNTSMAALSATPGEIVSTYLPILLKAQEDLRKNLN